MKITTTTENLAQAVNRALKVAPAKGVAYDKAAGIILRPTDTVLGASLLVASNNLEITYRERVRDVNIEGDGTWRLPAALLAGILNGMDPKANLTMRERKDGWVSMSAGKKRAKLNPMSMDIYPMPEPFDPVDFVEVPDFSTRVTQAAWATDPANVPFNGVAFDGEHVFATDRFRGAMAPCAFELGDKDRVAVPLSILTPVLRELESLPVQAALDGNHMRLAIGDDVRISSIVLAVAYPDVKRSLPDTFEYSATVPREALANAISSMLALAGNERYPLMRFTFEPGTLRLYMDIPQVGEIEDEVPITFGEEFVLAFTPNYPLNALNGSDKPELTWRFGPDPTKVTDLQDGDGYRAWVMPRDPERKVSEAKTKDDDDG